MTTGSDILSYQGKAYLGYGPDGSPVDQNVANESGKISSIIQDAFTKNLNHNVRKWQQAIQDRDDSQEMFATEDVDFPVEEQDREQLSSLLNDMTDLYISNPNIKGNKEAYAKMKRLRDDFRTKRAMAQTRYKEFAQQRINIANELDPETRVDMQRHLDEQMRSNVDAPPEPYLKLLDFDNKVLSPEPPMKVYDNFIGTDGLSRTRSKTDAEWMHDVYSLTEGVEGRSKTFYNQAQIRYDYLTDDERMDEGQYAIINKRLNEINLENGWKEGDRYFIKPIAKNGVPTENVLDYNKAIYFFEKYKSGVEDFSKEAQDMRKTLAQQKQAEAAASENRAQAGLYEQKRQTEKELLPFKKDEYEAKIEKAKQANDTQRINNLQKIMAGAKPVSDAVNTFHNVDKMGGYVALSSLSANDPQAKAMMDALDIGGATSVAKIPLTQVGAIEMLSTSKTNLQGKKVIEKPKAMFAIRSADGDPNKLKLVGLDDKGQVTKVVDVNQGINEKIAYESGYDDKKRVDLEGKAKLYLNEIQGGDIQGVDINIIRERQTITPVEERAQSTRPVGTPDKSQLGNPKIIKSKDGNTYRSYTDIKTGYVYMEQKDGSLKRIN